MDGAETALEQLVAERAQRLFLLSDAERKGFIVRRDMQRMRGEMPLTPEQLEAVFDSLDVHGNGYLTIDQFLAGFGDFLRTQRRPPSREAQLRSLDEADSGVGMPCGARPSGYHDADVDGDADVARDDDVDDDDDQDPMEALLAQIEDTRLLSSTEPLRQLVRRVRRDGLPLVQANLERFLAQLGADLSRRLEDARQLEAALKARDEAHHKQMQKLFEEMEAQLSEDKENIVRQEEKRLRLGQASLREQLRQRDEQLQEALLAQQQAAEDSKRLRQENVQLQRRKEELEQRLQAQREETARLQRVAEGARRQGSRHRQQHVATGFRLAWALLLEQQGLVQQLQMVRGMADTLTSCRDQQTTSEERLSSSRKTSLSQSRSQQTSMLSVGSLDDYEYDEEFYKFPCDKFEPEEPSVDGSRVTSAVADTVAVNTTSLQDEIALSLKEKGSPWPSSENADSTKLSTNCVCSCYSVFSRGSELSHLFSFSYHEFWLIPFIIRYFCVGTIVKYTTCVIVAYILMLILKYKCEAS
ncbi:EF-hand calcium-binding domain-containing protein 4A-like isoform X1 [Schistocerca nitens]|uniref:EF-hand calcium-binding domain-containing protein 4A-like isoform X1 n=2 Tax=Schistocerca nitens TaxID=7011 RepID=UPI002118011C|nr:EF-hand calcium-binding domain-containing protein 4A-like isoform X1 [Schistocerca nitens]